MFNVESIIADCDADEQYCECCPLNGKCKKYQEENENA